MYIYFHMKGIFFLVSSLPLYLSFFVYLNRGENRIPLDKSRTTRFASLLLLPAFVKSMSKKNSLPLWDMLTAYSIWKSILQYYCKNFFSLEPRYPRLGSCIIIGEVNPIHFFQLRLNSSKLTIRHFYASSWIVLPSLFSLIFLILFL